MRVCVFACLVCCVYVLASPVRSDGINDLQYVHTRPHTYTPTPILPHACGDTFVSYACATPSTHIRRQHDPAFRFVCANIVWCPLLFLCASCPAHARTRSTGRAWAVCVCAISVVVLLGVVLRHLSLRCIKCMHMWRNGNVCLSVNVYTSCVRVCARVVGDVCMHVYVCVFMHYVCVMCVAV